MAAARQGGTEAAQLKRARAHAAARRHSARVRFLKRAIPIGSGSAVAVVLFAAFLNPFAQAGITIGRIGVSGTQVTMENPRMTGHRGADQRPYEVTAAAAVQDIRKPNLIELKNMRGRLALDAAGARAHLEATAGLFDTQREKLELRQDVRVRTDDGQTAALRSALIDFKANTLVTKDPVTLTLTSGVVDADGMEVLDSGKHIVFTGRVRTVFHRSERMIPQGDIAVSEAPASPEAAAPAAISPEAARSEPPAPLAILPPAAKPAPGKPATEKPSKARAEATKPPRRAEASAVPASPPKGTVRRVGP
jgi:lipopolysaccharide export system protein LptC